MAFTKTQLRKQVAPHIAAAPPDAQELFHERLFKTGCQWNPFIPDSTKTALYLRNVHYEYAPFLYNLVLMVVRDRINQPVTGKEIVARRRRRHLKASNDAACYGHLVGLLERSRFRGQYQYWPTQLAIDFVMGKVKVPSHFVVFSLETKVRKVVAVSDQLISFKEIKKMRPQHRRFVPRLHGEKFNAV